MLVLLESGQYTVGRDGTASNVGAGDLLLCDRTLPNRIDSGDHPFTSLMMTIPRSLLRPHQDQLRSLVGRSVSGSKGPGRLVSTLLREIEETLRGGDLVRVDEFRLAQGALDVVLALLLADDHGQRSHPSQVSPHTLFEQVRGYIEDNLGDPRLDPASIAQAHFISVRLLYKLFEGGGPSVAEWIRKRRLERCKRDLADPTLADVSVMEISARWGFSSSAHFSRTFRTAVGCSPREYRQHMHTSSMTQLP
ncbi:helix-turn-helix domain-containing protein [Rhodococcus sp. T2V]|uniref:helix-turn-helix domain-containing protein n=1 Tax=Rhodococcus sp. T2V TaxID=3034164 RepID=UPI0034E1FAFA